VTVLPLILVGCFARLVCRLNFIDLSGLIAGSMTDPPALRLRFKRHTLRRTDRRLRHRLSAHHAVAHPVGAGASDCSFPMKGEGQPFPPGATWEEDGWNFSLYSRHANGVTLLIYDEKEFAKPLAAFTLDPLRNKTGRIWHTFVPHLPDARYYAYRVEGPTGPLHRFDPQKVLLDPFVERVFFPPDFSRTAAMQPGANDGGRRLVCCR
jgi:hypothetical protein